MRTTGTSRMFCGKAPVRLITRPAPANPVCNRRTHRSTPTTTAIATATAAYVFALPRPHTYGRACALFELLRDPHRCWVPCLFSKSCSVCKNDS